MQHIVIKFINIFGSVKTARYLLFLIHELMSQFLTQLQMYEKEIYLQKSKLFDRIQRFNKFIWSSIAVN